MDTKRHQWKLCATLWNLPPFPDDDDLPLEPAAGLPISPVPVQRYVATVPVNQIRPSTTLLETAEGNGDGAASPIELHQRIVPRSRSLEQVEQSTTATTTNTPIPSTAAKLDHRRSSKNRRRTKEKKKRKHHSHQTHEGEQHLRLRFSDLQPWREYGTYQPLLNGALINANVGVYTTLVLLPLQGHQKGRQSTRSITATNIMTWRAAFRTSPPCPTRPPTESRRRTGNTSGMS